MYCYFQSSPSTLVPVLVFVVAQVLLGCGGSPLFTLGTTYIDDHVKPESASMYIGKPTSSFFYCRLYIVLDPNVIEAVLAFNASALMSSSSLPFYENHHVFLPL